MTSKKSPTKKASPKKKAKSRKPTSQPATTTLAELAEGFLAHLDEGGKTPSTIASYRADLGVAQRHFGADARVSAITEKQVALFNASDPVTKTRAGEAKAKPGVDKTRRVLRLALVWAANTGLIETAPIPAKS